MSERRCPNGHLVPEPNRFCAVCGLLPDSWHREPFRPKQQYGWLFERHQAPDGAFEIIKWWEKRRLYYNLILFAAAFVSFIAFAIIDLLPPQRHADAVFAFAAIALVILSNLFYASGWMVELLARVILRRGLRRLGPVTFGAGLALSVIVVWIPTVINLYDWLYRLISLLSDSPL
jgi:hypothetical protein